MRICLINPPNSHELIGNDPVIIKDEQGCYPPLGLLSIAACLLKEGHHIDVIDAIADCLSHEQVAKKVKELNPEIVGVTVMTFTLIDCKILIEAIRKSYECTIVVGGPHCAIYPNESLTTLSADSVIVGEGEYQFLTLIRDFATCRLKPIYRQDDFIGDLDAIPYPARNLLDISNYYSILSESNPITTAFSSRGCPFKCVFCDRPALGKRFRCQTANRVVDEMQDCQEKGIKEIFFYDDTFTVNRKRVEDICSEYRKRNLTIRWDIRARVNTVDYALLKTLKSCNLTRIHFGVEAGSERVRRELNKGITETQIYDAFKACKTLGIKTLAYFMIGNPTETVEDLEEDIRMIKRIQPDYLHMTILSMFPATKIYETAKELGIVKGDPWLEYAKNPTPDFIPPCWDAIYSRKEHNEHLKMMYRKFYLRPSYIWKSLLEIRSMKQLKKYLKAGLALVRMK